MGDIGMAGSRVFFSGFGGGTQESGRNQLRDRTADHGGRESASGEGSDGGPAGDGDGGALQEHGGGNWVGWRGEVRDVGFG